MNEWVSEWQVASVAGEGGGDSTRVLQLLPLSFPPSLPVISWHARTMITAVGNSWINAGGYLQPEARPRPGATRASGLHVTCCNPLLPHQCAVAGGLRISGGLFAQPGLWSWQEPYAGLRGWGSRLEQKRPWSFLFQAAKERRAHLASSTELCPTTDHGYSSALEQFRDWRPGRALIGALTLPTRGSSVLSLPPRSPALHPPLLSNHR